MSEYTPGKWANIKGYIVVNSGYTIASVNSHNTSIGKANATLIAAAPELLDAAKHARIMIDHFIHGEESIEALHDAHKNLSDVISKAS